MGISIYIDICSRYWDWCTAIFLLRITFRCLAMLPKRGRELKNKLEFNCGFSTE